MSENKFTWHHRDLAHPGKRYQAQMIDVLVSLLLLAFCVFVARALNFEGPVWDVVIVAIPSIYFIFSDAFPKGQSIGKKLLHISVVSKTTGKHCNVWQALIRNGFTPILGIIDAALIFGKDRQRIGDKLANTIVIKNS